MLTDELMSRHEQGGLHGGESHRAEEEAKSSVCAWIWEGDGIDGADTRRSKPREQAKGGAKGGTSLLPVCTGDVGLKPTSTQTPWEARKAKEAREKKGKSEFKLASADWYTA